MGERKVLNKYISPDFDHTKIPRMRREKNKQIEVRMMIPFSMQCDTCGEFMYRGKKFNSKKEDVVGEDYKGIRLFRFYIKCITCSQPITFKTDPKNADYTLEHGATRNFEVWGEEERATKKAEKQREEEDKSDTMKALENRTLDSKIEMDILDALDEMKSVNKRHENVDTEGLLKAMQDRRDKAALEEGQMRAFGAKGAHDDNDEALIRSIQFGKGAAGAGAGAAGVGGGVEVRRLDDSDEASGGEESRGGGGSAAGEDAALAQWGGGLGGKQTDSSGKIAAGGQKAAKKPMIVVKKRLLKKKKRKSSPDDGTNGTHEASAKKAKPATESPAAGEKPQAAEAPAGGLLGLGAYSDSDSSE